MDYKDKICKVCVHASNEDPVFNQVVCGQLKLRIDSTALGCCYFEFAKCENCGYASTLNCQGDTWCYYHDKMVDVRDNACKNYAKAL